MNEWTEKMLLLAAGAVVGAVGYMAVKHPDELKKLLGDSAELGQKFFEKTMGEMAAQQVRPEDG